MGEETTQLDLSDELDRLEALRGGDDAGGELRVAVHDAVLDRETYVVSAVAERDPLALRVIEAPAASEQSAGDRIGRRTAVETATVAGYGDRPRFRVFDRYGRETTLEE